MGVRIRQLVRVPERVAGEPFLVREPVLLQVLGRLRSPIVCRWWPLLPLAIKAVEPCEVLLPLLDLGVGVARSVLHFLDGPLVLLNLGPVLLVIRVEHLDDGLL